MRKTIGIAILLGGIVVAAGHAQVPRREEIARQERAAVEARLQAVRGGFMSVEGVLRQREQLALSEAQVAQLEAIRKEEVTRRQNALHEAIDLESRIAAGLVTRELGREQMETRSEAVRTQVEQLRERIDRILTDEQREQLRQLRRIEPARVRTTRPGGIGIGPAIAPTRAPPRANVLPALPGARGRLTPTVPRERLAPSLPGAALRRFAPGVHGPEARARIAPGLLAPELRGRIAPRMPGAEPRVFPGARRPLVAPRVRIPRDSVEPLLRYRRRGVF